MHDKINISIDLPVECILDEHDRIQFERVFTIDETKDAVFVSNET